MTREEFEEQVEAALELVPDEFRPYLRDAAVIVEEWPSIDHRRRLRLRSNETLFGLYEGVPLTQRNSSYNLALPDRITIFPGPLRAHAGSHPQSHLAQGLAAHRQHARGVGAGDEGAGPKGGEH